MFLLVALIGQASTAAPQVAVAFEPSAVVVVTIQPPAGRTVKAITLE